MTQQEINKMFEGRWRIKGFDSYEVRQLSGQTVQSLCRDFFQAGILLAAKEATVPDGSPSGKPQKHPLALRAESFYQQVHAPEFTAKYPPQLLQDFFSYWSEPNRSKTKMRFELQKTWDTSRRLATWARNDFHHYANTQPTINQQRADKLASILTD